MSQKFQTFRESFQSNLNPVIHSRKSSLPGHNESLHITSPHYITSPPHKDIKPSFLNPSSLKETPASFTKENGFNKDPYSFLKNSSPKISVLFNIDNPWESMKWNSGSKSFGLLRNNVQSARASSLKNYERKFFYENTGGIQQQTLPKTKRLVIKKRQEKISKDSASYYSKSQEAINENEKISSYKEDENRKEEIGPKTGNEEDKIVDLKVLIRKNLESFPLSTKAHTNFPTIVSAKSPEENDQYGKEVILDENDKVNDKNKALKSQVFWKNKDTNALFYKSTVAKQSMSKKPKSLVVFKTQRKSSVGSNEELEQTKKQEILGTAKMRLRGLSCEKKNISQNYMTPNTNQGSFDWRESTMGGISELHNIQLLNLTGHHESPNIPSLNKYASMRDEVSMKAWPTPDSSIMRYQKSFKEDNRSPKSSKSPKNRYNFSRKSSLQKEKSPRRNKFRTSGKTPLFKDIVKQVNFEEGEERTCEIVQDNVYKSKEFFIKEVLK